MPYKNKCFSTCRKRPEPECSHPQCRYANGKQYQYCRLSHQYKLNADCEPELRTNSKSTSNTKPSSKKARTQKLSKQHLPLSPPLPHPKIIIREEEPSPVSTPKPSKEEIEAFRERYTKKNATRKIGRFLKKINPNKRRAYFLKSVCSDAGVCIAFGKESAIIRKHFDNFENFALLSKPAKRIGGVSSNGFVKELTYEHEGYVANAILKSSSQTDADNLLYEGLVGRFLNKQSIRLPSFLETYNIYQYKTKVAYAAIKGIPETHPSIFTAGLQKVTAVTDDVFKFSCKDDIYMSVLIQHLKEAKTLKQMINHQFVRDELLYVLFTVYMSLSEISYIYTHYDLHEENVLLYEPVVGSHIEYFYHIDGEIITFKSKYIAKIIDYGRSFFNELGNTSSTGSSPAIHDAVCRLCKPGCGFRNGFGWLNQNPHTLRDSYHICSKIANQSHDLRLLYILGKKSLPNGELKNLLQKVVYGQNLAIEYDRHGKQIDISEYGTERNITSGLPSKINNVTDAFEALKDLVQHPFSFIKNEDTYRTSTKLGELHVYNDGSPMQYIPV
jgi:hypothetical protein